jgi:hypothetical protein
VKEHLSAFQLSQADESVVIALASTGDDQAFANWFGDARMGSGFMHPVQSFR